MNGPLEPELHREVTARAKVQLRKRMRALRGGYSQASLQKRSERIAERLLLDENLAAAKSVALFWPMEGRGEVDLRSVDSALRERGVRIYYPFMESKGDGKTATGFRLVTRLEDLAERGNQFLEPPPDAPVAGQGDVDVVLVPALVADSYGHRIGYGAGYYDATLGDVCPSARSIIVIYHFQLLAELPTEPHDFACDVVLTDVATYVAIR